MRKVAVLGAGPGGLVVARYLKSEGFEPVVFEQGERIGGQWSADPGHSARTTSRQNKLANCAGAGAGSWRRSLWSLRLADLPA